MTPVRLYKKILVIAHDLGAVVICWLIAYWLRFNLEIPTVFFFNMPEVLAPVVVIHALSYHLFGLYRGIWRYASLMDLRRIILAVTLAALLVAASVLMFSLPGVPRSVLVLHPVLLILLMGGSRFAYRAWRDQLLYGRVVFEGEPVLVLGTGDAAERLLRELAHSSEWSVIGLLGENDSRVGHELRGVKILGQIAELPAWATRLSVRKAIVAMPEATQVERRRAMETAVQAKLSVLTVPSLEDVLSGKVAVSQVRQVELEDLLGRDPVQLDDGGLSDWLGGEVVLVSGAGGSIGSELVRQMVRFQPRLLVLLEHSEFLLYQIEQLLLASQIGWPVAAIQFIGAELGGNKGMPQLQRHGLPGEVGDYPPSDQQRKQKGQKRAAKEATGTSQHGVIPGRWRSGRTAVKLARRVCLSTSNLEVRLKA